MFFLSGSDEGREHSRSWSLYFVRRSAILQQCVCVYFSNFLLSFFLSFLNPFISISRPSYDQFIAITNDSKENERSSSIPYRLHCMRRYNRISLLTRTDSMSVCLRVCIDDRICRVFSSTSSRQSVEIKSESWSLLFYLFLNTSIRFPNDKTRDFLSRSFFFDHVDIAYRLL